MQVDFDFSNWAKSPQTKSEVELHVTAATLKNGCDVITLLGLFDLDEIQQSKAAGNAH